jgi:DNA-binding transcriptional regulator YiaG
MTPAAIRAYRASLGLSAKAFAAFCGVKHMTIVYRWETGAVEPHGAVVRLLELSQAMPDVQAELLRRAHRIP